MENKKVCELNYQTQVIDQLKKRWKFYYLAKKVAQNL